MSPIPLLVALLVPPVAAQPHVPPTAPRCVVAVDRDHTRFLVSRSCVEARHRTESPVTHACGHFLPVLRNGREIGFRLFSAPTCVAREFEIGSDDVLVRIDGASLATPDMALQEYERLKTAKRVVVELERGGKARTHIYDIVECRGSPMTTSQRTGLVALALLSCTRGEPSPSATEPERTPPAATSELLAPASLLDARWFGPLESSQLALLERHLRSSPRWDVIEELQPITGIPLHYAERIGDRGAVVRIGLGHAHRDDNDPKTTRIDASERLFAARLFPDSVGAFESYVVVNGAQGWTMEAYERGAATDRPLTAAAFGEVSAELQAALGAGGELEKAGRVDALLAATPLHRGRSTLTIAENSQPGIYAVTGWVNPHEKGRAALRIHYAGAANDPALVPEELRGHEGVELSADDVARHSRRLLGWSPDAVLFPYRAEVTVYEGDWEHRYRATFELWFRPDSGGPARRLASATETISGWQR